jgi:Domain of unknown function (DUF4136)
MTRMAVVGCILGFAAAGCAGSLHVTTDYDPSANFSQYHTYSWHDGTPAKDPLTDKKIVAAIDGQLQQKGFQKVEAGGDMTVTYHASSGQHVDLNTVYTTSGWGPYGWGAGGPYGRYWYGRPWGYSGVYTGVSTATTTADTVTTGTVVVDILDGKTHSLIWRGVGSDELNGDPKDLDKAINKGAVALFKDFPPRKRG